MKKDELRLISGLVKTAMDHPDKQAEILAVVDEHLSERVGAVSGPARVNKYYDKCMKDYNNKEYCARVAWNIYCSYVNPNHEGCTEAGKTWGPPYPTPLAKKAFVADIVRVAKSLDDKQHRKTLLRLAMTTMALIAREDPNTKMSAEWEKAPRKLDLEGLQAFWKAAGGSVQACTETLGKQASDSTAFCVGLRDMLTGLTFWKGKKANDEWVTLDQVRTLCIPCAEKMAKKGLKKIKVAVLLESPEFLGKSQ